MLQESVSILDLTSGATPQHTKKAPARNDDMKTSPSLPLTGPEVLVLAFGFGFVAYTIQRPDF